jgi:hypothetical protein
MGWLPCLSGETDDVTGVQLEAGAGPRGDRYNPAKEMREAPLPSRRAATCFDTLNNR